MPEQHLNGGKGASHTRVREPRAHGTPGCYRFGVTGRDLVNGCRCEACRASKRRDSKRRALHGPVYVDAAPAREHVTRLLAAGMTRHQIALLAGIDRTQLRHLMVGQGGKPPARGLRPETACAIFTVTVGAGQPVTGATCDATGTRRRLQALVALGWDLQAIADRIDPPRTRSALWQVARRDRVLAETAVAVRDLYEQLSATVGPSRRCAARAARLGWLPPLWWDDDTIDDPTHQPVTREHPDPTRRDKFDIDPIAVDRAVAGDPSPLMRRGERLEAVRRLRVDHGHGYDVIAARLHVAQRQVARDLADLGLIGTAA